MGKSILDRIRDIVSVYGALSKESLEEIIRARVYTDLWATERPLTRHWGSGQVLGRLSEHWGRPDVIFGKQDQVEGLTVDCDINVTPSVVAKWENLPFADRQFEFSYWDPPYLARVDGDQQIHYNLFKPCLAEICRVTRRRLALLHPMIYPNPNGWKRIAVIGVTFGPLKSIRALQLWERVYTT